MASFCKTVRSLSLDCEICSWLRNIKCKQLQHQTCNHLFCHYKYLTESVQECKCQLITLLKGYLHFWRKILQSRGRLTAPNLNYCNKNATGYNNLNKIISTPELEGNIFDRQITSGKFSLTSGKKSDGKLLEPCLVCINLWQHWTRKTAHSGTSCSCWNTVHRTAARCLNLCLESLTATHSSFHCLSQQQWIPPNIQFHSPMLR